MRHYKFSLLKVVLRQLFSAPVYLHTILHKCQLGKKAASGMPVARVVRLTLMLPSPEATPKAICTGWNTMFVILLLGFLWGR